MSMPDISPVPEPRWQRAVVDGKQLRLLPDLRTGVLHIEAYSPEHPTSVGRVDRLNDDDRRAELYLEPGHQTWGTEHEDELYKAAISAYNKAEAGRGVR